MPPRRILSLYIDVTDDNSVAMKVGWDPKGELLTTVGWKGEPGDSVETNIVYALERAMQHPAVREAIERASNATP